MSAVFHVPVHRQRPDNRAFNYAVLFSLLFHGALLFSFHMKPKAAPAQPGPIVARLAPASSAPAAAAAPQPEPPKPRVEEPTPPPPPPQVKPVPQPKPSPLAKAAPAPVKPTARAEATPSAPPVAAPAPSSPAPPSAAPSAPAVAKADPSPAPQAPAADSGTLDTYRMELMRAARNYKRYPRVAMDNNWEGKVVIRMVIGANGMISTITIVSSAGHEVLDKQALDMIQKAKPRVQIPAALRGREFTLEIPIIYSLKEGDAG